MLDLITTVAWETWIITARMAPYLLLGFLVAGALSVFISPVWLERHLGGRGMGPVVRAALFGIPLPLCSCGVVPVGASLRQHGASRAATTAFLLSTPQTGVDSILVTWTMLGPFFAVFRPFAALVTGLLGGAAVQLLAPDEHRLADRPNGKAIAQPSGLVARLAAALRYGLTTLPADIGRALLIGLVIAGVLGAVIPADFLDGFLGRGALSILLMMIVGIPIYVCATASVPVAAGFIFLGASPGAALAFLIAGPATNAATLTAIARILGRRAAVIFLLTVAVSAFGGGLLLDFLLPRAGDWLPLFSGAGHHHERVAWWEHLAGLGLVLVMTQSWWRTRRQAACCGGECGTGGQEGAPLRDLEFTVTGMNCSHCSGSVKRALEELAGVTACGVELDTGRAWVRGPAVETSAVVAAIEGLGYGAVPRP